MAVVIPARDEEERIVRCLESVSLAARGLAAEVTVIVVADGCLDRTAQLAAEAGALVMELDGSNVGNARAVGAAAAIDLGADWIANTDADSVVPADWLSTQWELAAEGADVTVGMVRPDFSELSESQREAWTRTHSRGESVGHVHGANLGIRATAYLRGGGFLPLHEHEDNELVSRLSEHHQVVATQRGEVLTSGRSVGRTPGGYARYLREELPQLVAPVSCTAKP